MFTDDKRISWSWLMLPLLLTGCSDGREQPTPDALTDRPVEAYSRVEDPAPEGAQEVNEAEFDARVADGGIRLEYPERAAIDTALSQLRAKDDLRLVEGLAQRRPELQQLLLGEPDPNDPSVRPSGDGNHVLTRVDKLGRSQTFVTLGKEQKVARIAEAIRRFPTYENQDRLYRVYHEALNAQLTPVQLRELQLLQMLDPNSEAYRAQDASSLKVANEYLSSRWQDLAPYLKIDPRPDGFPETCAGEEGSGEGSDRDGTGDACSALSTRGIQKNFEWASKYDATCVKDQGRRGTCGAFGILGAVEAEVARRDRRWVNLSEQDLYAHVKLHWWPSSYGDGVGTHGVWQKMIEKGYRIPFEAGWNYNPSRSRVANDTTQRYSQSCNGYDEFCSDTNHQGQAVCTTVFGYRYCGHATPDLAGAYRVTGETELWNFERKDTSLGMTMLGLILRRPIVISLDVVPSFDSPDADGYVTYKAVDGKSRGGHILYLNGYLDNSRLAQVFPNNPPPPGAGGGYFIVKNSWGRCYGDAGYVYLPVDWVKAHTWSMTVLSGLE